MAHEPDGDAVLDAAMIGGNPRSFASRFSSEVGTTLIETLVACGLLAIVITGLAGMTTMSSTITENQGHLSARTAEYAVDKMEQLLQLTYGDAQSDTTAFPSTTAGGTGLAAGGSSVTTAPVTGYTDYLDAAGNLLCPCTSAAPATWQYMRAWSVSVPSAHLKLITVTATVKSAVGKAIKAESVVSAYKTDCPAGC